MKHWLRLCLCLCIVSCVATFAFSRPQAGLKKPSLSMHRHSHSHSLPHTQTHTQTHTQRQRRRSLISKISSFSSSLHSSHHTDDETQHTLTHTQAHTHASLSSSAPHSNSVILAAAEREPPPLQSVAEEERPPSSLTSISVLMLLFYGTLGSVMPYLPIFYKYIGASASQIGFLGAITPAVTFVVSPLWGALADTTGRHKEIMLLTFIGSVLARALLALCDNNMVLLSGIVALSAILNAPVKPLLDSATMSSLKDKSAYGKCRLYGQVGFGVGSFLVGPLSSPSSPLRFLFLPQVLLSLPTALLMKSFEFRKKPVQGDGVGAAEKEKSWLRRLWTKNTKQVTVEKTDLIAAVKETLRDPKVIVFFLIVFIIGVSSGIIENFAYVRIAEVGGSSASKNVLGTMRLASSMAGGPMFWLSSRVVQFLGVNGVMTVSLIAYIARFLVYAAMRETWHALPAEMLRGITFATFWSGATFYVYGISPKGLTATMLGILNGMYAGLGQSLGSLIGGALCKRLGIAQSFYYCAAVDLAILMGFLLYQGVQRIKGEKPATIHIDSEPEKATVSVTVAPKKPLPLIVWGEKRGLDHLFAHIVSLFHSVLEAVFGVLSS